jgi:hypothetical protein
MPKIQKVKNRELHATATPKKTKVGWAYKNLRFEMSDLSPSAVQSFSFKAVDAILHALV